MYLIYENNYVVLSLLWANMVHCGRKSDVMESEFGIKGLCDLDLFFR